MSATRQIGLFGGTFNPIHVGHVRAASAAAEILGLEKVIFIPSALPPHKPLENHVSPDHRLAMVKLAVARDERLEVSDIEIARGGESYTLLTLREMRRRMPEAHFTFLLGVDAYLEIHAWYKFREVLLLADWAVIARPGYRLTTLLAPLADFGVPVREEGGKVIIDANPPVGIFFLPVPETEVSSSRVRAAVRENSSLDGLVSPEVAGYILRNNLYRDL